MPSDLMRHGGYTETAPLHLIDITETVLVIDALIDNIKQYAPEE